MGVGSGMQTVDCLGCNRNGRVETESNIGAPHVVVDGFRNSDYVKTQFANFGCRFHGSVTADTHQAVEPQIMIILFDQLRFVDVAIVLTDFERLFT